MSRTPTRRIGRLKSTLVLAALAVGMVGGAAAPALAEAEDDKRPPGFENASHGGATPVGARTGDYVPAGWSWFR